jgi:hypothetical protein
MNATFTRVAMAAGWDWGAARALRLGIRIAAGEIPPIVEGLTMASVPRGQWLGGASERN